MCCFYLGKYCRDVLEFTFQNLAVVGFFFSKCVFKFSWNQCHSHVLENYYSYVIVRFLYLKSYRTIFTFIPINKKCQSTFCRHMMLAFSAAVEIGICFTDICRH